MMNLKRGLSEHCLSSRIISPGFSLIPHEGRLA